MPAGRGEVSYLDAATVEPGLLAHWAQHSMVGYAVPHRLQADDAVDALCRSSL